MNKFCICIKNMLIVLYFVARLELTETAQTGNTDMPNKRDLWKYLNTLDRMLNFCASTKTGMNINIYFGLFLVNVNLKEIIQNKANLLPMRLQNKLNELLRKSTMLTKYFKERVTMKKLKLVSTLFTNESFWIPRIKNYKFVIGEHKTESRQRLQKKYYKWYTYLQSVKHKRLLSRPDNPGICMTTLAKNLEKSFGSVVTQCNIDKACYDIIIQGFDFGYSLSHRLLLLLLARFGRGCSIFISVMDEDLTKRFCEATYAETEHIILHNDDLTHLLLEQMSLCSLNGHPEFLQIAWLSHIMELQAPKGCILAKEEDVKKTMNWEGRDKRINSQRFQRQQGDAKKEICSDETTSTAAAVFAAAIRYIVTFSF